MSLCFFVPAEQSNSGAEGVDQEVAVNEDTGSDSTQQSLQQFWSQVTDDIRKVTAEDFKTQALPLARIKKIMKLDEEVKMISAEAPVLFAKAAEIFIHELTLRAWSHTEDNKRRTLQRNDIAMAISRSDMFDFLIDIVPRHEVKPSVPRADTSHSRPQPPSANTGAGVADTVGGSSSSQCTANIQSPAQPQFVIQSCQPMGQQQIVQPSSSQSQPSGSGVVAGQQPVTLLQQVVTAGGEVQQVPIQLTAAQLNMIRMQVQNNPNQPIIIQAAPQQQHSSPHIIQVSSQAQHQGQQQVYLQVANQED